MKHLYHVGQMLEMRAAARTSNRPDGVCQVVFCLPHDRGPLLYRVKSRSEGNERVVSEADLSPTSAEPAMAGEESAFSIAITRAAIRR